MKKILLVCCMLLGTMGASAQFVVYESVDVPQTSRTQSMGYGTPFSVYEPVYGNHGSGYQQQPAKQKMQEVTLKGYYKKNQEWYHTPIRVGMIGNEVKLLGIKTQYGWSSCGNKASEVGAFDPEEIRENFNYKVFSTLYGMVYF